VIELKFRPIDTWPGGEISPRPSPFSATYGSTLRMLERELDAIQARNVVLQVALDEGEIRRDGQPYSRAKARHPGIIIAFDSKYGPLKYATAAFTTWQDNIRAVALGLEALRKVDRYGITKRGEQYTGWKALPSATSLSSDEARTVIMRHAGVQTYSPRAIRLALLATHPDQGGTAESFAEVQSARRRLEQDGAA
jgi:hypothetical protein